VEHSEGKDGESDVAILRFLWGSPHPCRLRTMPFWPGKPSSHVTTSLNRTPCLKNVVGGGMRPRSKTSPVSRGPISMK
jgi:hypothetical protein